MQKLLTFIFNKKYWHISDINIEILTNRLVTTSLVLNNQAQNLFTMQVYIRLHLKDTNGVANSVDPCSVLVALTYLCPIM